jgi:predicted enzyme related to lactoylglutathione lyase
MKKVTGIGGVFFKCKDPEKVKEWYNQHLGMDAGPYGANFDWRDAENPSQKGCTAWNTFTEQANMFEPSAKEFMINYRVENLTTLVGQLKEEGVTILDSIETYSYGKFVHIIDAEGNKIQLWEPVEE